MQLFGSSPEQKYREFLEAFAADLDRRHPGLFQWRIGRPSPDIVEGLIVTQSDVGGYAFVVGACQWSGGIQGGVWREGARHSYSASVMKHREWEHSGMSHSAAECLESQRSEQTEAAPWLLENATRREAQRIAAWAAEKKSRRRRLPALKLLIFPGQHHSRKASLMLTSADLDGASPRLEIQATGGNTRLHDSAWRRPLEIDLIRYQV